MPVTLAQSEAEFSAAAGNPGVLSNSLCVIISPDHSFCERKNVWGFGSLVYETTQLDSLSVTRLHESRLCRR